MTLLISLSGCAVRKPGGRADRWITQSYGEGETVYNGVGFRF